MVMHRGGSTERRKYAATTKRLHFEALPQVGREGELRQLKEAFQSQEHPIVAVSGLSGVGKTKLVSTFANHIEEAGAWLLMGKFEKQASVRPYSAISIAMEKLAEEYRESVQKALRENPLDRQDAALIYGIVPSLVNNLTLDGNAVVANMDTELSVNDISLGTFRSERIHNALASFLQLLSRNTKVVIWLDDVHWADQASFDLIQSLVKRNGDDDSEFRRHLMLVLTYRTNELENAPMLASLLSMYSPLVVELGNLNLENLNKLVALSVQRHLDGDDDDYNVLDLTKLIYHKTEGNVLFSLQVLTWLQSKLHLYFSIDSFRWEWDLAAIEWDLSSIDVDSGLTEKVVNLVCEKLRLLPPLSKRVVIIASCLGSRFDKGLMSLLLAEAVLPTVGAESSGIPDYDSLVKDEILNHKRGTEIYRFSHDRIQQAAYLLFEKSEERERTHMEIGRCLLSTSETLEYTLLADHSLRQLLATNQMNLGSSCLIEELDKRRLFQSNLDAVLVAINKSAFVQAQEFIEAAVRLFSEDQLWTQWYGVALLLHSTWAETLLTLGKLCEVDQVVDLVLRHAKTSKDACRAIKAKMMNLNSANQPSVAFPFGYQHLQKMGLRLPRKPNKLHMLREFMKVVRNLDRCPPERFLEMTKCSEADQECHSLIILVADTAVCLNDSITMLYLYLKVANLAFVQGPSRCTATAMVQFGVVRAASGKVQEASEVYDFVNRLADRFQSRIMYAQTFTAAHFFLHHLRHPMHLSIDQFLKCYDIGMQCGDMLYACNAIYCYSLTYFMAGLSLDPLICDVKQYRKIFMGKNNCDVLRSWLDCLGQCALNLSGEGVRNPFDMNGEFVQGETFLDDAIRGQNNVAVLIYWMMSLYVTYILDPCSHQVRSAFDKLYFGKEVSTEIYETTIMIAAPPHNMMNCLAAISLERDNKQRKYTRKRKCLTKILQKYVLSGIPGVSHRLLLVEAELMTLDPKVSEDAVKNAFDKAISTASRTGFKQDCAIANERCGEFFERRQDQDWAEHYLGRARELYQEWRALSKVKQMDTRYPKFLRRGSCHSSTSMNSGLRARERFKASSTEKHDVGVTELIYQDLSEESLIIP